MRQKWKRKSGWITPASTLKIKKQEIFNQALEPRKFYDDWENFRDSFRDWFNDFKKIKKINRKNVSLYKELFMKRIRMNKKQKKLLRRKVRKKCLKFIKNGESQRF